MSHNFAPPPHDPDDLDVIVQHRLELAISEGRPPQSVAGWTRKVRENELENERMHQGWIRKAADGIRHSKTENAGQPLTHWKEVRGSHGISFEYDPAGIDRIPAEYGPHDLDKARAEYDERQARIAAHRRRQLRAVE